MSILAEVFEPKHITARDDARKFQQKRPIRIWKPSFYPLNYGDGWGLRLYAEVKAGAAKKHGAAKIPVSRRPPLNYGTIFSQ